MNAHPRDTTTRTAEQRATQPRDGTSERARKRERERRIGAAQLAAPSTRTWRRTGRFDA